MTRIARIVSTASFLPEVEVTNQTLKERLGPAMAEAVDKLEEATGIRKRWWAPDGWSTSDLALPAARLALEKAGREPEDVDLIILGTDSPDYLTPATSVVLQHKLGARNAGSYDVGCACASFPTGLANAAGLIAANPSLKTVQVVGVYLMHRLAAPDDPLVFLYGDGAGAAVLDPPHPPPNHTTANTPHGSYHHHWGIFSGGTAEPATEDSVRAGRTRVRMLQRYPPEINHEGWPRLVRKLSSQDGFTVPELDMVLFSQVRKPSIELVMADLGLPLAKTHTIMEEWGYTGSACLGMALDDAVEKGVVKAGDLVAFVGSGVGYNQAGAVFRVGELPGRGQPSDVRAPSAAVMS
jgi:3-oxoacyl-[acyl-carrier-protein] synthase-3